MNNKTINNIRVRHESSKCIATMPGKHTIIFYSLSKRKIKEKECVKRGFICDLTQLSNNYGGNEDAQQHKHNHKQKHIKKLCSSCA